MHQLKTDSLAENAWVKGRGSVMDVVEAASGSVLGLIWTPEVRPYKFQWIWMILIAFGFLKSLKPVRLWLVLIWVLLPSVGVVMFDMLLNTHATSVGRYFFAAAPALYLLLAIGIAAVRPRQVMYLVTIVVLGHLVMGGYLTGEGRVYQGEEYKRAAQEIAKVGPDQRVVVISKSSSLTTVLAYYLANYPDQPETIDIVAGDLDQAEITRAFDPERRYSNLTIVVGKPYLKIKNMATLTERLGTEKPGYLELVEARQYRGLTVLSFRSARST
jgi:hypothetical protein